MKYKILGFWLIFACTSAINASIDNFATNVPEDAKPSTSFQTIMKERSKEIRKKGYIESYSTKYEFMINLENNLKYKAIVDVRDTSLRKNASDVVGSSPLKKVSENLKIKTLGYAPVGSFDKNLGWTGLTEIFKAKDLGLCQFTHLDLKASGGGYSLLEDKIRTDVNGHYTAINVTGKKNQGFDYEVIWFNDLNMYTLNCIHKEYSNQFKQEVIDLAKQIDEN